MDNFFQKRKKIIEIMLYWQNNFTEFMKLICHISMALILKISSNTNSLGITEDCKIKLVSKQQ